MRTRFDQIGKHLLAGMSAPLGTTEQQREIVTEPQAADLWFEPAPAQESARARLGLFGRMLATPCMLEYFHATPSLGELLDCMSKQLNLRRMLRKAARPQKAPRQQPRPGPPAPGSPGAPEPRLWILSAGRPEGALRALALVPMAGWPAGLWQTTTPPLHMHLAVLRDLPEERDTLLLRVLGRGRTFHRAMQEIHALPDHAWEAALAIPLLLAFRVEISQNGREGKMQHHANELQAIYEDWERRVKHASWKAGEEAGRKAGEEAGRKAGEEAGRQAERRKSLQDNLRLVYEARFGALPPALQAVIESTEDSDTLQQWIAPFATRTPEELAALARGR